jgi:putative Mg2+ transporter-C (MgtC) family protein
MSTIDYELFKLLPYFLPKVIVATICGGIIGYERELKQKVAGIRTNILICVGCAILTALSFYISSTIQHTDPTRIIGQIITGIGFLGAGVIMKHEDKIIGVTTAAFIWVVSSIGVMVGFGAYITPILLTIGLLIISRIFERVERSIKNKQEKK